MIRIVLYGSLMGYSGCVVIVNEPTEPRTFDINVENSVMTTPDNTPIHVDVPDPIVVTQTEEITCRVPDMPEVLSTPTLPPRQDIILTTPLEVENYLISHIEMLMGFIEQRTAAFVEHYQQTLDACQ